MADADPKLASAAPKQMEGDAPVGLVATRLAEALAQTDVLYIATDEQRAEAVAAALRAAAPDAQVIHSPSSDAFPGEDGGASPSNVGRRVAALRAVRLAQQQKDRPALAFITTAEGATAAYPLPRAFDHAPPLIAIGDEIDLNALAEQLDGIGYFADDRVDEPGEMAVRGQVVDLFPADSASPVRIELDGNRVTAIRRYDAVSQLGQEALDGIEVGRVVEPPIEADWTPLFDHLPSAALAIDPGAMARRDRYIALAKEVARNGKQSKFADAAVWAKLLGKRRQVDIAAASIDSIPRFVEGKAPLRAFARFAKTAMADGARVVLLGAERDLRFLGPRVAKAVGKPCEVVTAWREVQSSSVSTIGLLMMPVERGWRSADTIAIAAADLLGGRALKERDATVSVDTLRGDLGDLHLGDIIVHEDFGIGRLAGIEQLSAGAPTEDGGDAIVLEYAGGGRRLVAVDDADRLWRYGAGADAVTLDKLDGSTWEKRRGAIDAAIAESARGLTVLATERAKRTSTPLLPDTAAYERFAAGFAFTETADQARAIDAVRADLASAKPMDRLVVGDVGYGKTEVALRAAAITALAGKQVAIAAPTTVLVRQHLEVFGKRFADTGLVVAGLSRLSTAAQKKAVKAGLADGSIHIVVGTGAVAAKDVAYHDLALVVIDEEQRFGASDKAKLRALNTEGHVLTLTATPIPRTLQSALIGLQQVSVIATPPARRQPIRTSVGTFDDTLVRAALLREKGRKGQSFVVVPRIEDMAAMAERIAKLVPDLIVRQAHGKMPAGDIDEAMVAFANGDGDVLLATNIIEAGLDVPRANTMIVWHADRFGLSQLHQLRGRVGRGGRRGQIMLVTNPDTPIAEVTLKRLRTLEALDRLGAGFAISARDLDMRGAGDLLGDEQAGHMKLIGVDLYQHLIEGALRTARGEHFERWSPVLRLGVSGRFPAEWIPEPDVRIALYCRLSRLSEARELDAYEEELEDRFGALPDSARTLLSLARLRLHARDLGIARIDAGPTAIALTPRPGIDVAHAALEEKDGRLILREAIADPDARLERISLLMDELAHD